MNIKSLFTYNNLFQINSAYVSPAEKMVFFAAAALVLLAMVFKIASRLALNPVDKAFRDRFYRLFLSIGIAELLWYLCRYENANFFGSHFVALVIALIGVIWFLAILVSMLRYYGKEKTNWNKEQVKLKYLPK